MHFTDRYAISSDILYGVENHRRLPCPLDIVDATYTDRVEIHADAYLRPKKHEIKSWFLPLYNTIYVLLFFTSHVLRPRALGAL